MPQEAQGEALQACEASSQTLLIRWQSRRPYANNPWDNAAKLYAGYSGQAGSMPTSTAPPESISPSSAAARVIAHWDRADVGECLGMAASDQAQARATRRPLLVGRRPMTRVGGTIEKGETQGFIMAIADAGTHQILGAAILGTGGDEAIHGTLDAMNAQIPCTVLQRGAYPPDRISVSSRPLRMLPVKGCPAAVYRHSTAPCSTSEMGYGR